MKFKHIMGWFTAVAEVVVVVGRSCIQGSYRFWVPKCKTFSTLFPKQYFIFPYSRLTNR